jgi:hypothetical protein
VLLSFIFYSLFFPFFKLISSIPFVIVYAFVEVCQLRRGTTLIMSICRIAWDLENDVIIGVDKTWRFYILISLTSEWSSWVAILVSICFLKCVLIRNLLKKYFLKFIFDINIIKQFKNIKKQYFLIKKSDF